MDDYNRGDNQIFSAKVVKALEAVRKVLHVSRNPRIASEIHHHYDDKYLLVEFLVNTAIASQLNCLSLLGLTRSSLELLRQWVKHRSVSVKVPGLITCTFVREETREVESSSGKHITDVTTSDGVNDRHVETEHKVITKVTDYVWTVDAHYEVIAYSGTGDDPAETVKLLERKGNRELKTHTKTPPRKESSVQSGFVLELSWLLSCLDPASYAPRFFIDRKSDTCKTPCRNSQALEAFEYFGAQFPKWAAAVTGFMLDELGRECEQGLAHAYCDTKILKEIFEPVLPLLEDISTNAGTDNCEDSMANDLLALMVPAGLPGDRSVLLAAGDANHFLTEELRSLEVKRKDFAILGDSGVFTGLEASISLVLAHARLVAQQLREGILFVENMLRSQLIAAIGQQLTPGDFARFMRYHNRKLFKESFEPQPFSYSIRRSGNHAPEGTLSIEECSTEERTISQPLITIVNSSTCAHPMQFPLGSSTKVTFTGSRYIHAACLHQFSSESGVSFNLEARTRQFSSMIVLVGKIASATLFEPTHAVIIQNKDELTIPLQMSTIPTPKEFRDAIESLSPEQQAFAKAFRAMQLASTLFGVLVIQIKPQMEKLLGLPVNALTKEVLLTQDLMKLFIDFQISSDLLSYTGDVAASEEDKLNIVKSHVESMHHILKQGRQSELAATRAAKVQELSYLEATYKDEHRAKLIRELSVASSMCSLQYDRYEEECCQMMMCVPALPMCAPPMCASMSCEALPSPPLLSKSLDIEQENANCLDAVEKDAKEECTEEAPPDQDTKPTDDKAQNQESRTQEEVVDYTQLPKELDRRFQEFDEDNCLRPTIITPGEVWKKRSRAGVLSAPSTSMLCADELKEERNKAFDLLDALTKSGGLSVEHASLHIILAATHCFDKSIIETVIQDNKNPIEKVERSTLIMATTIHRKSPAEIVQGFQMPRIQCSWPALCNAAT